MSNAEFLKQNTSAVHVNFQLPRKINQNSKTTTRLIFQMSLLKLRRLWQWKKLAKTQEAQIFNHGRIRILEESIILGSDDHSNHTLSKYIPIAPYNSASNSIMLRQSRKLTPDDSYTRN